MSFSAGVKEEIAGHIPRGRQERLSSLAALLFNLSRVEIRDSCDFDIVFADGPEKALRKCFTLLKKGLNIDSRLRTDSQGQNRDGALGAGGSSRKGGGGLPDLTESDRKKLLDTFGMHMWEENGGVSPGLIRSEKCARAYLMDTFLCVGSVSDPGKDYHLEFNCRSLAHAKQILALLYMLGKSAGFTERKSRFIVYLKDSQDIIDLLGLMGAHISMMDMENQRIRKDVVNTVNRRVNCDTANAKRTVGAAQQQIRDIRFLEERGILKVLPEKLREMAELRTDYPELPLGELGQMLQPPVSKSGVNHRLKKLSEIAEKERSADHKPQPAGGGE